MILGHQSASGAAGPLMPLSASATLFAAAWKLMPSHGVDATTVAALAGGLGTLLLGGVNLSREVRVWLDRRKGVLSPAEARDARADARDTRADARDSRLAATSVGADARDVKADTRDCRADARDTRADARDVRADAHAGAGGSPYEA